MQGDLIAWAQQIAPRVSDLAAQGARERKLPAEIVDALFEQDVFRALVPVALGGQEKAFPEFLEAIEVLGRADASTAWCVNQGAIFARMSAWAEPAAAAEIWGDPRCAIGNGPPPPGVAKPVPGGFEVTGRWSFSSGCQHASWIAAQARIETDGPADHRMFMLPRDDVEFHDTWDVAGLRATGSFDFSVDGRFVPEARAIRFTTRASEIQALHGGPLSIVPMILLFACGFAAVGTGLARGALDDALAVVRRKTARFERGGLSSDGHVLEQVGVAEARLHAARGSLFGTVGEVWSAVVEAETIDRQQRILLRMSATHCLRECAAVVAAAYNIAGTDAIHASDPLQRRVQDMHLITQHVQARTSHYVGIGEYFVTGEWSGSPYI